MLIFENSQITDTGRQVILVIFRHFKYIFNYKKVDKGFWGFGGKDGDNPIISSYIMRPM